MVVDIKLRIRNACRMLLRPIVSVVLKSGMTWKEFANLSKSVYVDVASDEFGLGGRPTNISRTSILTGISRKEIKRQRELLIQDEPRAAAKTTDATRVLSGWHQDAEYLDASGNPLPLPETGDAPSFESLFARYGGDTPQQTMLKELLTSQSIEKDDKEQLVARRRYYMPTAMSDGQLDFFGRNLFDHAHTLNRNLSAIEDHEKRFEGFSVDDHVSADAAVEFKNFVDERGQQFLEEVDAWLNDHRADQPGDESKSIRLGVGLYAIDGPLARGKLS